MQDGFAIRREGAEVEIVQDDKLERREIAVDLRGISKHFEVCPVEGSQQVGIGAGWIAGEIEDAPATQLNGLFEAGGTGLAGMDRARDRHDSG